MTQYTRTHLSPKNKLDLSENSLSSFGNDNIRSCHIIYFQNKILEYKENESKDLSSSPNYYAWLCLISEDIFWRMKAFCFWQSGLKEDNLTLDYNVLISTFCEISKNLCKDSVQKIEDIYTKILKVLVIRHATIHLGFPNLFPIQLKENKIRKQPTITKNGKKEKFSKDDMEKIIAWYSNPKNFIAAKTEFDFLMLAMKKGPGISVGF